MQSTIDKPRLSDASTTGTVTESALTSGQVWRALEKASFAVISYVTPAGKPRSSGVVYAVAGRRMYVAVAPTGWKGRQIADGAELAVTVPVHRGGLLALMAPIPPATISFHARVTVHPARTVRIESLPPQLVRLLPPERESGCLLELVPEGSFLTYGIGVSLLAMRHPTVAQARVPVA
jgi:hypothetical protein